MSQRLTLIQQRARGRVICRLRGRHRWSRGVYYAAVPCADCGERCTCEGCADLTDDRVSQHRYKR